MNLSRGRNFSLVYFVNLKNMSYAKSTENYKMFEKVSVPWIESETLNRKVLLSVRKVRQIVSYDFP